MDAQAVLQFLLWLYLPSKTISATSVGNKLVDGHPVDSGVHHLTTHNHTNFACLICYLSGAQNTSDVRIY